ncbi:thioredoxin reductase [Ensifer sp. WSM1721]|uniref:FAD-dependent oxidoreductase n=1 Tax=Ensifer sp. WSM1721 TaxID=1041159 RepID=UPI0004B2784C|nr:FAD-dependent oxidoreductase [Ensifer sp. WSM1721]
MLAARGVEIAREGVVAVEGSKPTVILAGGRKVPLDGLFTAPRTRMANGLPEALGRALEEGPLGPYIRTDATKATSVAGVFACGDAARAAGSVSHAVGDGVTAGMAAHRSLIFDMH